MTAIWARYNSTEVLAQATRHVAGSSSWSPTADLTVGRPITAVPAAGVDPQGHVTMVWSSTEDPWSGASSVFDPIAPDVGDPGDARERGRRATDRHVGQPVRCLVCGHGLMGLRRRSVRQWRRGQPYVRLRGRAHGDGHRRRRCGEHGADVAEDRHRTGAGFPKPRSRPRPRPQARRPAPKAPVLSGLQQSNARWRTQASGAGRSCRSARPSGSGSIAPRRCGSRSRRSSPAGGSTAAASRPPRPTAEAPLQSRAGRRHAERHRQGRGQHRCVPAASRRAHASARQLPRARDRDRRRQDARRPGRRGSRSPADPAQLLGQPSGSLATLPVGSSKPAALRSRWAISAMSSGA